MNSVFFYHYNHCGRRYASQVDSVVAVEAGGRAGLGVEDFLVGELGQGVDLVGGGGDRDPVVADGAVAGHCKSCLTQVASPVGAGVAVARVIGEHSVPCPLQTLG